jgi:hypothetical protein
MRDKTISHERPEQAPWLFSFGHSLDQVGERLRKSCEA